LDRLRNEEKRRKEEEKKLKEEEIQKRKEEEAANKIKYAKEAAVFSTFFTKVTPAKPKEADPVLSKEAEPSSGFKPFAVSTLFVIFTNYVCRAFSPNVLVLISGQGKSGTVYHSN